MGNTQVFLQQQNQNLTNQDTRRETTPSLTTELHNFISSTFNQQDHLNLNHDFSNFAQLHTATLPKALTLSENYQHRIDLLSIQSPKSNQSQQFDCNFNQNLSQSGESIPCTPIKTVMKTEDIERNVLGVYAGSSK
jgi:hypothetical protein